MSDFSAIIRRIFRHLYLNCHSYYSFRYGTIPLQNLVAEAARFGIARMALTDINHSIGTFEFVRLCKLHSIDPVIGVEFRDNQEVLYIGLAHNNLGFNEINILLSNNSNANKTFPSRAPQMDHVSFIYPLERIPNDISCLGDNEFVGVRPNQIGKIILSRYKAEKLVALYPTTFLRKEDYFTHQLLRCIDLRTVLDKLPERACAGRDEVLSPPDQVLKQFSAASFLVENAANLLAKCSIDFSRSYRHNLNSFRENPRKDHAFLTDLVREGLRSKYPNPCTEASSRIYQELNLIREMGLSSYFLVAWDLISYAKSKGYSHVGRGSGANSIVAYCLGITNVDPIDLGLFFERFVNRHRPVPPDFDIDFSWQSRDNVISYMVQRYGVDRCAMLASLVTFKGKSLVRELGKVFGLRKNEIDLIIARPLASEDHHPVAGKIFEEGRKLIGFPNFLSAHPGGVIISEKALTNYSQLARTPKGHQIVCFDMHSAEYLGFHKFDILSQRGLGHIGTAMKLIKRNQGVVPEIFDFGMLKRDEKTLKMLSQGRTIGCFYIESPTMRSLLRKLQCSNYLHLVAASSIIRPGVSRSGMFQEYLMRYHGLSKWSGIHQVLKKLLQDTFGIMVYQEDVMKVLHHFAGLTLDEADLFRRIMNGKRKSSADLINIRKRFFSSCEAKGHAYALALEVWSQVEAFSGYSFCKAHSATFAVESLQSLYLKAHFPLEFIVAVINNFGGYYETEFYLHEAKMLGGKIELPCVNRSHYYTVLSGSVIVLGLTHLKGMESSTSLQLVEARSANGPFRDLQEFVERTGIRFKQLEILIRIGAFRFTGRSKADLLLESAQQTSRDRNGPLPGLFKNMESGREVPEMKANKHEQAFEEMNLLGYPLCSPFDLIPALKHHQYVTSRSLKGCRRPVRLLGYYMTSKDVTTSKNKLMKFASWIDMEGQYFDSVHFPAALERYPFEGPGCYELEGRATEEFGFVSLLVTMMKPIPYIPDPRFSEEELNQVLSD